MWALKFLLIALAAYLAVVALAFFAQTALLFPTRLALPAGPAPPRAVPLALDTPSGHRLHGLHVPPAREQGGRLLVLGFGGNAWNAAAAAEYLHDLYPHADIVAFHYRGYAPSGGRPGTAALQEDALAVHDLAVERLRPDRTVAVGFSIGAGAAAFLAARRPIDGAILVTPFDSLAELAAGHYRWLPVRWLLRHRLEPAEALRGRDLPVAVLAAGNDAIVPRARTDALRAALSRLVYDRTIAGAGHNDLYVRPDFQAAMREAMDALEQE